MIHCRLANGEYRQLFEAVPELGTGRLPKRVARFMGMTQIMVMVNGRPQMQEVRFPIGATSLREAWLMFTGCEMEAVGRLAAQMTAPKIEVPGGTGQA